MTDSNQDGDHREVPVVSRRAMILGAGAVGAVGVLAACGSDETPTTASTTTPATTPATAPATSGSAASGTDPGASAGAAGPSVISAADIPVGGGTVFRDQQVVVTQPTAGDYKAFSAMCTHQSCLVGDVSDGKIICRCHMSQFSITDGAVLRGPANRPLGSKTLTERNGSITID